MSGPTTLWIGTVVCQVLLLAYHQITTLVDFYPFNAVKNYLRSEKLAEVGINAILMGLPPLGFVFRIHGLMLFGVVYYFVLLFFEVIIWWVPYFTVPTGAWRTVYNLILAVATSSFESGDKLDHWVAVHQRTHRGTKTPLQPGKGPVLPNWEHMILHAWTVVTAVITLIAYRSFHG